MKIVLGASEYLSNMPLFVKLWKSMCLDLVSMKTKCLTPKKMMNKLIRCSEGWDECELISEDSVALYLYLWLYVVSSVINN